MEREELGKRIYQLARFGMSNEEKLEEDNRQRAGVKWMKMKFRQRKPENFPH